MVRITIPSNQDWRRDQAKELLDAIEKLEYQTNNTWEMSFLDAMKDIIEGTRSFTDKQLDKLSEIYRRASNGI